jgi:hypothetical protein
MSGMARINALEIWLGGLPKVGLPTNSVDVYRTFVVMK